MSTIITPTLFVGRNHDQHALAEDIIDVFDATGAVAIIRNGGIAALPDDAWDDAKTVLIAFGADPQFADDLLNMARHGRWLPRPVRALA